MKRETTIPGMKARHAIITPTCRENRTEGGAFDEAVRRLREDYDLICAGRAGTDFDIHMVLTVEPKT